MFEIAKSGRYCAQKGRNFAAQMPRTIRRFHGAEEEGGTEAMAVAMRRMIFSALLVSFWSC